MKNIYKGYQCESCHAIYADAEKALKCENEVLETPLIPIGTILDDEQYESKIKVRLSKIYRNGHEICYRFEMDSENGWVDAFSSYGNKDLIDYYGDQIEKFHPE